MCTRDEENREKLKIAAEELYLDYINDAELTIFFNLDHEDFYEAK